MKRFLKIGCGSVFAIFMLLVVVVWSVGSNTENTVTSEATTQVEENKPVEAPVATEETKEVVVTEIEESKSVEVNGVPEETKEIAAESDTSTWEKSLNTIINNSDSPADKFYAVEKLVMSSPVTEEEINVFKTEILSTYKNKTYLADPYNNEVMLNLIFKSFAIERNTSGTWKEFAFDYFQNVKYVYRGVDAPDSEAVLSNENQMNKVIDKLK